MYDNDKILKKTKIEDLSIISRSCFEPDPFTFDECFESCNDDLNYNNDFWDVSLDEIDFDQDLDATIFTYTVNVWKSGVCQEPIINHYDENEYDENKYDQNEPTGIEGFYILFNGCCNDSNPIHFTKAITPKLNFEFLSIGWYWKTKIMPNFKSCFGFMIFGDVELTIGHYCVRTNYHCICQEIIVPDLCKNKQFDNNYDKQKWSKVKHDHDNNDKKIDDKPIWGKQDTNNQLYHY